VPCFPFGGTFGRRSSAAVAIHLRKAHKGLRRTGGLKNCPKYGDFPRSPLCQCSAGAIGQHDFNNGIDNRFISRVPLGGCLSACFPI
jgi:hypothetical protein